MGIPAIAKGPVFSSGLHAPSPELRSKLDLQPEQRLYLLNTEQNHSWGETLRQDNVERGILSTVIDVESLRDTRMIASNEGPKMRQIRSQFIDRSFKRVSFTIEVENLVLTQDFLRTAWLYGIPVFPIRSLEQAEQSLAEMRRVYG